MIAVWRPQIIPYSEPVRVVAPTLTPVTDLEVSQWLNLSEVDVPHRAMWLKRRIVGAVEWVENYTGLGLMPQVWKQTFSAFANPMPLHRRPLLTMGSPPTTVAISYRDSDGAAQTVPPQTFRVAGIGVAAPPGGEVWLASGQSWPVVVSDHNEAVTVIYNVGFGVTAATVPEQIKEAIYRKIATTFEFREEMIAGASINMLPDGGCEELLRPWRAIPFA